MLPTASHHLLLLLSSLHALAFTFTTQNPQDVYRHHRLEELCPKDGSKVQLFMNTEVNVFKFNSSLVAEPLFRCHLELEVRNSNYGFSVFIEEMSLSGSSSGCDEDYLQFGRDILFVTSHRSGKYCGDVEPPVARISEGLTGFDFPITPLVRRIYTEELDKDMDVWLKVTNGQGWPKSLTLVVTPFKKFCGSKDVEYRQCRYSTKCVRKELFCDGRVNCAWPYSEPADEVYCKDISAATSSTTVWKSSNIPVIIVVSVVVLGAISLLCFGLCKLTSKVKKFNSLYSEELCHSDSDSQQQQQLRAPHPLLIHRAAEDGDLRPSCPPLPPLPPGKSAQLGFPPPPPPYSPPRPLDAPPSYAALAYQRS